MATTRRIGAIKLLHSIKQQKIDDIGRQLAAIRMKHATVGQELCRLRESAIQAANGITPETLPFLAGYLKAIDTRRAVLEQELQILDTKALAFETELTAAFIDAKTSETVLDTLRKEQGLTDRRKDLAESAEVAQNIYLQQNAVQ